MKSELYRRRLVLLVVRLGATKVVLLHAPEDMICAELLEKQLSPAVQAGTISVWHLGMIRVGDRTRVVVLRRIEDSDVLGVLISPDLQSESWRWVLDSVAERIGPARVIPVLVRPVEESHRPFPSLWPTPCSGRAISQQPRRRQEAEWARIAQQIVAVSRVLTEECLIDIGGLLRDAAPELGVAFRRVARAFGRADILDGDWVGLTRAVHDGETISASRGRAAVRDLVQTFLSEAATPTNGSP